MTNILIGIAVCIAPLVWAIATWKLQMARSAQVKRTRAEQRAIFNGGIPRDTAPAATPTRRSRQFGRR